MSVHFNDLTSSRQCRFPLWAEHERTGHVCGEETKPESPYCRAHHRLVYVKPTKPNLRRMEFVARAGDRRVARAMPAVNVEPEFEDMK